MTSDPMVRPSSCPSVDISSPSSGGGVGTFQLPQVGSFALPMTGGPLRHPATPATGTPRPSYTRERYQVLAPAAFALKPRHAMFDQGGEGGGRTAAGGASTFGNGGGACCLRGGGERRATVTCGENVAVTDTPIQTRISNVNSRDLFAGKSLRAPATIDDEGLAGALALPGRPLRPPRPRRCRPHARGPPRRPHPRLDLGGVDAPYARSRCPRLAPLWRPAAHRRHHPGSGTSCAPSSPTSTWRRAPTSPAPPLARPHRRHPVTRGRPLTGAARSPAAPRRQGPPSAPLPPPVTTAGFRAHHPRKESAPNGAVSAPSRVLRPVHHGIPRPPCRPPPAPCRAACR